MFYMNEFCEGTYTRQASTEQSTPQGGIVDNPRALRGVVAK